MNPATILRKENIKLGLPAMHRDEAIALAGRLLVESGFVAEAYVDAMYKREDIVSTFIGNGVAIPHGVGTAKQYIHASGIVVLQFPEGIDYNGNTCHLVIGISGKDDEHIQILANIAEILSDDDDAEALWTTTDVDHVHALFTKQDDR